MLRKTAQWALGTGVRYGVRNSGGNGDVAPALMHLLTAGFATSSRGTHSTHIVDLRRIERANHAARRRGMVTSTTLADRDLARHIVIEGTGLRFVRGYATTTEARRVAAEKKVCREISETFLGAMDADKLHADLKFMFTRGRQSMRDKYQDNFLTFLEATRDGLTKALDAAENREQAFRSIADSLCTSFIHGVAVCNFLNLTARASHLYGDPGQGFFTFEQVYGVVQRYNRFALQNNGVSAYEENSVFLLLCHQDTKKMIESGELTPKKALEYALALGDSSHPNYSKDNPLSKTAKDIHNRNFTTQAAMGACS